MPMKNTNRPLQSSLKTESGQQRFYRERHGGYQQTYAMGIKLYQSVGQKSAFFRLLVDIGFKEIEIAFPSASNLEYDFTRYLVENPHEVPNDVWLQVLSPCREECVRRTIEAMRGAKKAIFHLYIASSPQFRELVFKMSEEGLINKAVECTQLIRELTKDSHSTTEWILELGLEAFEDTPLDFSLRLCEAVKAAWGPCENYPIIFNLAATVEISMPNRYADQVEFFSANISNRHTVCVSVHPHNDRGCAIAAAEMAQLAGAERVEGCLLGNGERTGNVDLVTLALNLYSSGVNPGLNLSDVKALAQTVSQLTQIPIPLRAPYVGDLVFCTFAGSHQDALKKGYRSRDTSSDDNHPPRYWAMPYLPIDPADIGRVDEEVIRITSQSGKAGAAYIIEKALGLDLPRGLQTEFSDRVKDRAAGVQHEMSREEIIGLFQEEYRVNDNNKQAQLSLCHEDTHGPAVLISNAKCSPQLGDSSQCTWKLTVNFVFKGFERKLTGFGKDTMACLVDGLSDLGYNLTVRQTASQKLGTKNIIFTEVSPNDGGGYSWNIGMHTGVLEATILSVLNTLFKTDKHRG
ncbi:hypothetical protein FE257_010777 [Aspergillus nanangensis]|uniref:2-isopropylmalate synthase n=1 Tax=Aspergillus nanangensis TaxID=2582783 RepID=A0AAD4CVH7_ASPNN|nr:hypothetical protein FE257_010777 [Aspergillus nanangensis]